MKSRHKMWFQPSRKHLQLYRKLTLGFLLQEYLSRMVKRKLANQLLKLSKWGEDCLRQDNKSMKLLHKKRNREAQWLHNLAWILGLLELCFTNFCTDQTLFLVQTEHQSSRKIEI